MMRTPLTLSAARSDCFDSAKTESGETESRLNLEFPEQASGADLNIPKALYISAKLSRRIHPARPLEQCMQRHAQMRGEHARS
jgi:hypothetical protein